MNTQSRTTLSVREIIHVTFNPRASKAEWGVMEWTEATHGRFVGWSPVWGLPWFKTCTEAAIAAEKYAKQHDCELNDDTKRFLKETR